MSQSCSAAVAPAPFSVNAPGALYRFELPLGRGMSEEDGKLLAFGERRNPVVKVRDPLGDVYAV